MAELDVGVTAPDFDLPRDGGGRVNLAAFKGKPVVVFFYPKDDTSGCTVESIAFTRLAPRQVRQEARAWRDSRIR
jgi:peroxiredoxin Q/BCP